MVGLNLGHVDDLLLLLVVGGGAGGERGLAFVVAALSRYWRTTA
jgi:hypothetical protein